MRWIIAGLENSNRKIGRDISPWPNDLLNVSNDCSSQNCPAKNGGATKTTLIQLVLQRIHELQEQAAVTGNAFSFFYAAGELNAAVVGFARVTCAGKFSGAGLYVDERLVFGIAKNGGVRNGEHVLQGAAWTDAVTYISFFNFLPGSG